MARTKPRYWIGCDGEGIGRKPHRYSLLAMATADGWSEHIRNSRGLPSGECLEFFLSAPTDGRLAGYYLGYDWTMILRDLPDTAIYRLLRPELRQLPKEEGGGLSSIRWKGFQLNYLAGKMAIRKGNKRVTVWDLGKYFQATFVESIDSWGVGKAHSADIARMKLQRSEFSKLTDEIVRYCITECRCLAELAEELESAHEAIGLRPRVWHGPGSTAATALGAMGIAEKRGEAPAPVQDAADRAFFGGRFEHSMVGRIENVWGYDIVSAYPYQSYNLPCLEHGTWVRRKLRKSDRHALVPFQVKDVGRKPWAPLPCRLSNGTIVYPRGGFTGWAWLPEFQAAQEWDGVECTGKAWVLESECICRPFARVLEWFRERIAVGKTQRGRVLKLVLNSIYGKTAQTVGKPQFGSRIWAGMITAGTRAQLLRMMLRHKRLSSIVALATDGLYSTERIKGLAMPLAPDTLGSWEADEEPHGAMVFVRPGIYWAEDDELLRARGIGRRNLGKQRKAVLQAIQRGDEKAHIGNTTLFGGARACVYRTMSGEIRRSSLYGQWHEIPARISLDPAPKRNKDWSTIMLNGVESAPYRTDIQSLDAKALMALAEIFWGSR